MIKGMLFILLITYSNLSATETLKVASIDWCPQLCVGTQKAGFLTEIVNLVFEDSPYQLDINISPWSRSIQYVKTGKVHALLSPAKREAPELLYPRNEIGTQKMCFFTNAESTWVYSGTDSLKGKKIGIAQDTSIEELSDFVIQNKEQFQFMPYNDSYIEQSLGKLKLRRVDSFLFTKNSTLYKMKQLGNERHYRLAGCVSEAKIYMAFTPEQNHRTKVLAMMEYFDSKLDNLKKTNKIRNIMTRYGLSQ